YPTTFNEEKSNLKRFAVPFPDSEEVSNFINIFVEEHGEAPSFNIFESCEKVEKKGVENRQFCQSQTITQINKRWGPKPLDGPISIDFINQMLEARKVKSYPYSHDLDPYVV
ncbi:unnamed protein product, partial [Didymodactylos carnosus]